MPFRMARFSKYLLSPSRYNEPQITVRLLTAFASAGRSVMVNREELLSRVAADAESIIQLTRHGLKIA